MAKAEKEQKEKVKLTVSSVLADLEAGIDRKGIREKYGLTATDVSKLFEHPKLKGKRVRRADGFELEDDTDDSTVDQVVNVAVEKKARKPRATAETAVATAEVEEEKSTPTVVPLEQQTAEISQTEEITTDAKPDVIKEVSTEADAEEQVETKQGLW